jgi:virginiamycin B lyase
VLIAAGLIWALAVPVAEAAPGLGTVKEYRLPTSTDPHEATAASDGNVWVTVQGAFDPETFTTPGSVARVEPRGTITEFAVCDGCITNDLVQGPDGIVYVSDNDGQLRRITTSGEVLSSISHCGEVFCDPLGGVAADPEGGTPLGIAAAPDGNVWFTQNLRGNIARITPDGVVTEASRAIDSPTSSDPTRSGSRSVPAVTRGTRCRSGTGSPPSGCAESPGASPPLPITPTTG